MKIFKKNQLALLVISLMLITAGYLNYTSTFGEDAKLASADTQNSVNLASIGDAELVNANAVSDEKTITTQTPPVQEENNEVSSNNSNSNNKNYFTTSKLERNVMYSQMIERYQEVLENQNAYADQKTIAGEEIASINELQNAIMIAENLLTTKGFTENIIFVNGESVSVIIGKAEASKDAQDEIAQIQNIVSRELKAEVNNIHISLK